MKRLCTAVLCAALVSFANASPAHSAPNEKYEPWSVEWFQHHRKPKDKYWDRVAQCETKGNWKDKGMWGGGLGISITTWQRYGGNAYARHPSRASREEQIVIANRVAVKGFVRRDGSFQYPAGFGGWGCIKNNKYLLPHPHVLWYKWKH